MPNTYNWTNIKSCRMHSVSKTQYLVNHRWQISRGTIHGKEITILLCNASWASKLMFTLWLTATQSISISCAAEWCILQWPYQFTARVPPCTRVVKALPMIYLCSQGQAECTIESAIGLLQSALYQRVILYNLSVFEWPPTSKIYGIFFETFNSF